MTVDSDRDLQAAVAVTRFGMGARPGEIAAAVADPKGFLKAQIRLSGADQPPGDLPAGAVIFARYAADQRAAKADPQARRMAQDARRDTVLAEIGARAALGIDTDAGFRERWALFWSNHFTVSTTKGAMAAMVGAFDREAIRPHVFGRFEDLLVASTRHPAMLLYLDQARSAGPDSVAGRRRDIGLNENLAREIMELHTLGVGSGYTQADVTEFARALTGWSMDAGQQAQARQAPDGAVGDYAYRPQLHQPGARLILGRTYPDAGEDQARAVLADLAAHPATARHLADKLARHFVADEPAPALSRRLETAFTRSHGRLDMVAQALIDAPEAWDPAPRKFKTPYEFLVSAYRGAGIQPTSPRNFTGVLGLLGQRPYSAPSPKGWPDVAGDWAAPDAIINRMAWAERFGQGAGDRIDPMLMADACLGPRLGPASRTAVARAESRPEALAVLLMSPEFQRR